MLFLIVNGFPVSINCETEGYLVDTFLPPAEEVLDYENILVVELDQLPEPFEQYFA